MTPLRRGITATAQRLYARQGRARCPRRVVFLHIPKTAGSSVNTYFKRRLGTSWRGQAVTLQDDSGPGQVALAEGARFVGGHFGGRRLSAIRGDAFAFTFLRDPLARFVSAWRFYQSHADERLRLPFETLEAALASGHPLVALHLDNVIARQLATVWIGEPGLARSNWSEAALATLASLDVVGAQERFDTDLAAMLDDLGLPAVGEARRSNVTGDPSRKGAARPPPLLPPREELAALAEPWIALDREVIAAWQAR